MRACDACTKSLVGDNGKGWQLTVSKEHHGNSDSHEFVMFDACDHKCMTAILQALAAGAVIGDMDNPLFH